MKSKKVGRKTLGPIDHFVVLMLENRSFDHLLGSLHKVNSRIEGLKGTEFNYENPAMPDPSGKIRVSADAPWTIAFDPGHEYDNVHEQLFGDPGAQGQPIRMNGFIASAVNASKSYKTAAAVMKYFIPGRLPVLSGLALEFAVCDHWHSALPGPTWPNRFFVHAATSGGLTASPNDVQMIAGYSFKNGTIYDRLDSKKISWRIYHDGFPQTAGIDSLREKFIDPFTKNFRDMEHFEEDLASRPFPQYVFIEPRYGGDNFRDGNSEHPENDIRRGEALIKRVYDALHKARETWAKTMLIITYDEHGGFYDHVAPPKAVAPGDAQPYLTNEFDFKLRGVRVPAVIISPYTKKGTVVSGMLDHTSILKTVENRFGLKNLTQRDLNALPLDAAVNLAEPRQDAPEIPDPASPGILDWFGDLFRKNNPLTQNQLAILHLAMACDLMMEKDGAKKAAIHRRVKEIDRKGEAVQYLREAEERLRRHRKV